MISFILSYKEGPYTETMICFSELNKVTEQDICIIFGILAISTLHYVLALIEKFRTFSPAQCYRDSTRWILLDHIIKTCTILCVEVRFLLRFVCCLLAWQQEWNPGARRDQLELHRKLQYRVNDIWAVRKPCNLRPVESGLKLESRRYKRWLLNRFYHFAHVNKGTHRKRDSPTSRSVALWSVLLSSSSWDWSVHISYSFVDHFLRMFEPFVGAWSVHVSS